jgi:serine/threonine protein kinase
VKNLIGHTLLNQFRVDAFVASGGMGVVYRVWDLKRNVPLAMKILHADLADDPSLFKRFRREARALQKLTHPNIVPFYGIYQTGDLVFLLERYIDGPSLKDILRSYRHQPLPLQEVLAYLKALCAAVGYAHASGVIHCDIKPGNVMVDQGGNIYLTDFGIARHAESTTTTLATAGTAAYMAPEQIRGEPVNPATDVYALGILLFEMLTGYRPFQGSVSGTDSDSSTAGERIRYEHLHIPPPDPKTFNPNISDFLAQVLLKALAKDPDERYSDTQMLFNEICSAIGVSPVEVEERVSIAELPQPYPRPWAEKPPESDVELPKIEDKFRIDRRRLPVIGAIGLIVFVLIMIMGNIFVPPGNHTKTFAPTKIPAQDTNTPSNTATTIASPTPLPSATPTSVEVTRLPELITDEYDVPMVLVSAGLFEMGNLAEAVLAECQKLAIGFNCDFSSFLDEEPVHTVTVEAYYIDRFEVTNARYASCVEAGGCNEPHSSALGNNIPYFQGPEFADHPVVYVSWSNAQNYCTWRGARLPTEAEWEKAARGTDGRHYPWGDVFEGSRVNFCDSNCEYDWANRQYNDGYRGTAPAGSYPAGRSPYGVLDMAGNVWEWVADWYGEGYYASSPSENPPGPATGEDRVLRGGGFNVTGSFVRTGTRLGEDPTEGYFNVGFRCASTP